MRTIYSLVFYLLLPAVIARLFWRGKKAPAYRQRWKERFGFVSRDSSRHPEILGGTQKQPVIWLHAVSVGESLAAMPLVEALLQAYPQHRLLMTTSTPTGSEQVTKTLGSRVWHSYAPYDLPDCVARFLSRVQPDICIIMETELWPNTIAACHRRNIPVVLANARLSAKSAKGYERFGGLSRGMINQLDFVASQHEQDLQRFASLGLPEPRGGVTGNIKFDIERDDSMIDTAKKLQVQWSCGGERLVVLAASTHRGEDELLIDAFAQLRQQVSNALLVLVPRHPERFNTVLALCKDHFECVSQRSLGEDVLQERLSNQDVIVADTMGELSFLLGASDIVFVGGSLVENGGHNMIEPAQWGLPIVSGSSLFNFSEASRLLLEANAMLLVNNGRELAEVFCKLGSDLNERKLMGERAQIVADKNRGALEKLLNVISQQLPTEG